MKKIIGIAGIGFVLIALVVLVRTIAHTPPELGVVELVEIEFDDSTLAQHLSEAIQFPTVSHQDALLRDQQAFDNFVAWVANTYPELHGMLSLQKLNDTLLYKWQGTDTELKPILITGHYDVVPVIPGTEAKWDHLPFAGEIVDGVIWGRGALDDKSGVVGILEATNYLVKQGFVPSRSIYLSFGHDEELGGPNGAALVASTLAAEGVQLAWSLDEGSFVFDKMFPGIEPLMAAINVAEKGGLTLQIVAKAAGGHSSVNWHAKLTHFGG
jgi:carboxypeptidase PM20D1